MRVNSAVHQLKLCRSLLPHLLQAQLWSTLVFPHFDYCCLTYLDLTRAQNLILDRSLNACVRCSLDVRRDEHITEHYQRLEWLKEGSSRLYFLGCLLFKILTSHMPKFSFERLALQSSSDDRQTNTRRSKDWLQSPTHRTALYRNSFTVAALYRTFGTACRLLYCTQEASIQSLVNSGLVFRRICTRYVKMLKYAKM